MDRQAGRRGTRHGAVAAFVSALATVFVGSIAIKTGSERLSYWNDPWIFLDALLLGLLAFGVGRQSRAAVVILLFYFAVSTEAAR